MSDLVKIFSSNDGEKEMVSGAIVCVIIPNKWILSVSPDHPAYSDMFNEQVGMMPTDMVRRFYEGEFPHITKQLSKVILASRNEKV